MKRDMLQTSKQTIGKIPTAYDLKIDEMELLGKIAYDPIGDGLWDAIGIAFRYGFALGMRYEKKKPQPKDQGKA